MEKKEGKTIEIEEEYNRLLVLLSGTTTILLQIDKYKLDQEGYFINKFVNKISIIIDSSQTSPLAESIKIKVKKILSDSFIYLS